LYLNDLRQHKSRHDIKHDFQITQEGKKCLSEHHWPGNVRELENLVERIVMLEEGGDIGRETLQNLLGQTEKNTVSNSESDARGLADAVEQFEKEMIEKALAKTKGNKNRAAQALGLTRQSLQYKLKKYGVG